jgi:trigger factor
MSLMKTEFTEVSETRKHLSFEVPPEVVTAEIERVAQKYSRSAQVPGFRRGKVPAHVVRQRYKDQILHDVAHDLIPRLVGNALRERGVEPIVAPDIKDVVLEEGQPLTFGADVETLPPIDPGEYTGLSLRKPPAVLEVGAVDRAIDQLRERHARWQPIEDRTAEAGDTLLVDLTRTRRARLIALSGDAALPEGADKDGEPETLENVGGRNRRAGQPPGIRRAPDGYGAKRSPTFTVAFPADYEIAELKGQTVDYDVTVKGIRRKELLALDDEFAKEVSDVATLEALQESRAPGSAAGCRGGRQSPGAARAPAAAFHAALGGPDVLVEQEIDRRLDEFIRRLMEQGLDPMQVNVNWQDFRERQRPAAVETVKSTLVLDEIGRRESIAASEADLEVEIGKFADSAGRTTAAIRASLEKEGAIGRLLAGIRREKNDDLAARAGAGDVLSGG